MLDVDKKVRILIVDDHPIIRSGLASVLHNSSSFLASEAESPEEARRILPSVDPDVLVLDIFFDDDAKSGFDLAEWARTQLPEVKIVIFTSYGSEGYVRKMVRIGVEGYITKDEPLSQVARAIEAVSTGHLFYSSSLLPKLVSAVENRPVTSQAIHLALQEAEILQFVAEGATNQQIAMELNLSNSRVRDVIQSACTKLGAQNRTSAAVRAAKLGYINI